MEVEKSQVRQKKKKITELQLIGETYFLYYNRRFSPYVQSSFQDELNISGLNLGVLLKALITDESTSMYIWNIKVQLLEGFSYNHCRTHNFIIAQ